MTKQIVLSEKIDCEHLLGKFLEHDAYNFIVNEDCDVYKPLGPGERPHENNCPGRAVSRRRPAPPAGAGRRRAGGRGQRAASIR